MHAIEVHSKLGPGLLESVYEAQISTYLKLSGIRTGLLINFLTKVLKDGLKRIVC